MEMWIKGFTGYLVNPFSLSWLSPNQAIRPQNLTLQIKFEKWFNDIFMSDQFHFESNFKDFKYRDRHRLPLGEWQR